MKIHRSGVFSNRIFCSALSMVPRSTFSCTPVVGGNKVQQISDALHGELHFQVFLIDFLLELKI
jgi:hypothetical protein